MNQSKNFVIAPADNTSYTSFSQALYQNRPLLGKIWPEKPPLLVPSLTIAEALSLWLAEIRPQVKLSTYAVYKRIVSQHLQPQLGGIIVPYFNVENLKQFIDHEQHFGRIDGQDGLSEKTIQDILCVLKSALQLSGGVFPSLKRKITSPLQMQNHKAILTQEEQLQLTKHLKRNPSFVNVGILLCLYTGLRIGELCALTWQDFNWRQNTLSITKTMQRVACTTGNNSCKTQIIISTTKTSASMREIPIPVFLLALLTSAFLKSDSLGYLLTGSLHYLEPRTMQYHFKRCLHQAGLLPIKFHALRHTFATRCIEQNVDVKTLSELLGHSNINITMQQYVHPTLQQKRIQIEKLMSYF